jgi:hypothetical protein
MMLRLIALLLLPCLVIEPGTAAAFSLAVSEQRVIENRAEVWSSICKSQALSSMALNQLRPYDSSARCAVNHAASDLLAPFTHPERLEGWRKLGYYVGGAAGEEVAFRWAGWLGIPDILLAKGLDHAWSLAAGVVWSAPAFLFLHTYLRWLASQHHSDAPWNGFWREIGSEFYAPTEINTRYRIVNRIFSPIASVLWSRFVATILYNAGFASLVVYAAFPVPLALGIIILGHFVRDYRKSMPRFSTRDAVLHYVIWPWLNHQRRQSLVKKRAALYQDTPSDQNLRRLWNMASWGVEAENEFWQTLAGFLPDQGKQFLLQRPFVRDIDGAPVLGRFRHGPYELKLEFDPINGTWWIHILSSAGWMQRSLTWLGFLERAVGRVHFLYVVSEHEGSPSYLQILPGTEILPSYWGNKLSSRTARALIDRLDRQGNNLIVGVTADEDNTLERLYNDISDEWKQQDEQAHQVLDAQKLRERWEKLGASPEHIRSLFRHLIITAMETHNVVFDEKAIQSTPLGAPLHKTGYSLQVVADSRSKTLVIRRIPDMWSQSVGEGPELRAPDWLIEFWREIEEEPALSVPNNLAEKARIQKWESDFANRFYVRFGTWPPVPLMRELRSRLRYDWLDPWEMDLLLQEMTPSPESASDAKSLIARLNSFLSEHNPLAAMQAGLGIPDFPNVPGWASLAKYVADRSDNPNPRLFWASQLIRIDELPAEQLRKWLDDLDKVNAPIASDEKQLDAAFWEFVNTIIKDPQFAAALGRDRHAALRLIGFFVEDPRSPVHQSIFSLISRNQLAGFTPRDSDKTPTSFEKKFYGVMMDLKNQALEAQRTQAIADAKLELPGQRRVSPYPDVETFMRGLYKFLINLLVPPNPPTDPDPDPPKADIANPFTAPWVAGLPGWGRALYHSAVAGLEGLVFRWWGLRGLPANLAAIPIDSHISSAVGSFWAGPFFLFAHTLVRCWARHRTGRWDGWGSELRKDFWSRAAVVRLGLSLIFYMMPGPTWVAFAVSGALHFLWDHGVPAIDRNRALYWPSLSA